MADSPHRTMIVIAVHNRRETTLACLRRLRAQGVFTWATPLVVDAGSVDGTAAAVQAEFPESEVLPADENLFWTGATELGMRRAIELNANHVFWLNDDTQPDEGALAMLLDESRRQDGIAGGVCYLPGETVPAYGGLRKTLGGLARLEPPGAATVRCDALHGNLVCIPARVIRAIGYPDHHRLPHALGDLDYTMRARRAGVPVLLVAGARGTAQPNLSLNYRSWLLSDVPVREWWRALGRRESHMNLRSLWCFHRRHWGLVGALHCAGLLARLGVISCVRLVVPVRLLRRLYGRKSSTWQHEQRHRQQG